MSFGQNDEENLKKYWFYKNRLNQYFMKVGYQNLGESNVAQFRSGQSLKFGDQTCMLGWNIGVLATEYKLLYNSKQDVNNTLYELYCAFKAYKRLDLCEAYEPWNVTSSYNGFFIRDDVPTDFVANRYQHFNKNIDLPYGLNPMNGDIYKICCTNSSYEADQQRIPPNGQGLDKRGYNSMSQDQAIHLFLGFALTHKCLPDASLVIKDYDGNIVNNAFNFKAETKTIVDNIITYIENRDRTHGPDRWQIYMPIEYLGEKSVYKGAGVGTYSVPIAEWGNKITGENFQGQDINVWNEAFWGIYWNNTWNTYNNTMTAILTVLSDDKKFSKMQTRFSNYDWQSFYLLLWKFLNNKTIANKDWNPITLLANSQLNTAPCVGPYNFLPANKILGWSCFNKFRSTKDEQNALNYDATQANFNGIDYMLLFNLYNIDKKNTKIVNYNDRKVDNNTANMFSTPAPYVNKVNVIGFNKIESTMKILTTKADGSQINVDAKYRAGVEIILKPGFEVEHNATFHAYIDPFSCPASSWTAKSIDSTDNTILYDYEINKYDSAISVPYSGDIYDFSEIASTDTIYFDPADTFDIAYDTTLYNIIDTNLINKSLSKNVTTNIVNANVDKNIDIELYPNPNNGNFVLQVNNIADKKGTIKVYSTLGNVVYSTIIENNRTNVNIKNQTAGVYFARIEIENQSFYKRVIIK